MTATVTSKLFDLADPHGGHFTTAEALAAGLTYRQLTHHTDTGTLERPVRGVYRLATYPQHQHADLIVATLWAGLGSAVSHDSALGVYGLAAAMPALIHLTVPRQFTGERRGVHLYLAPLSDAERRVVDDVTVTSPERTLLDVARTADPSLVREAVRETLDTGLTSRRRLAAALASADTDRTLIRRVWGVRLPAAQ